MIRRNIGIFVLVTGSAAGGWFACGALMDGVSDRKTAPKTETLIGRRAAPVVEANDPGAALPPVIDLREIVRWGDDGVETDELLDALRRATLLSAPTPERDLAWMMLGKAFATRDPAEVAEAALELDPTNRDRLLRALIGRWPPASTIALVDALEGAGIDTESLWQPLVRRLGNADPSQALAMADRLNAEHGLGRTRHLYQVALWALAKVDPARAAKKLEELDLEGMGSPTASAILLEWVDTDPAAAVDWIRRLAEKRNQWYLSSAFESLGKDAPGKLTRLFERMPELLRDPNAVRSAAQGLAANDPQRALEWVRDHVPGEAQRNHLFNQMISRVDAVEDQLMFLGQIPDGTASHRNGVDSLAQSWAIRGEAEAMTWAESLEDPGDRRAAVARIFGEWADEHPGLFLEYRDRIIEHGLLRDEESEYILNCFAEHDPELAKEWVRALPEDLRDHALIGVGKTLARANPGEAAAFLDSMPESPGVAEASQHLVTHWTLQEPEAAAEWAGLQTGESRNYAFRNLVHNWAPYDATAASAWLAEQPDSPAKDWAAAELVEVIAYEDPAAAYVWADSIGDEKKRARSLRQSFTSWIRRDRDAAFAALDRTDLPPETKKKLRSAAAR